MAVKIEDNATEIRELSLALDGISDRLTTMESSLQKIASGSSHVEKPASGLAGAPAEGSADLESISRQVAFLMEELAATKEVLATTKGGLEKIGVELSKPKDIGKALFEIAGDPEKFAEGLDKLVERVSSRIEDPAARQNFEVELAQLRERILTPTTPEELYQELRQRHLEKLNFTTDEKDRRAIERGMSHLENCSEEELQKRLTQYARERTLGEFFRIAKTEDYGLQREDLVETWFARPDKK